MLYQLHRDASYSESIQFKPALRITAVYNGALHLALHLPRNTQTHRLAET